MQKKVRFVLKRNPNLEAHPIRLQFVIRPGERVIFQTGEYATEQHFDTGKGRIADKYLDIYPHLIDVNETLDDLESFVIKDYNNLRRKRKLHTLTKQRLLKMLRAYVNGEEVHLNDDSILSYYQSYIDARQDSNQLAPKTKQNERACFIRFREFYRTLGYTVPFEDLKLSFFESYRDYLWNHPDGMLDSTVHTHLRRFKQAMSKACADRVTQYDAGVIKLRQHLMLSSRPRKTDAITEKQLKELIDLDLTRRPGLSRTRDLFICACYTGLRFNRWGEIHKRNIIQNKGNRYLRVFTKKGQSKEAVLPIHPVLDQVASKYNWELPKVPTNQVVRKQLKEIAQLAGWNQPFKRVVRIGGVDTIEEIPFYQLVLPHMARRTFVTICKAAGMTDDQIKPMTTHATSKMVAHYNKQNPLSAVEALYDHDFFKPNKT
ncbi:MAG: phage integrase SAM-like domain-containing protein [Bacteroidota bacterium]